MSNASESKIKTGTLLVVDRIHLDFGLRGGIAQDGSLFVHCGNSPGANVFPGVTRATMQKVLASNDIRMIGREEVTISGPTQDAVWNFFYSNMNVKTENIDYIGSGLKKSLQKKGKSGEINAGQNVIFSLRAMLYRLRDVSGAYGEQASRAAIQNVKPGRHFSNLQTLDLFLNIHSFLVETATLRDHLASFLSATILGMSNITKMTKLVTQLKKDHVSHPISAKIIEACDPADANGWLARLSSLRNFVVHSAPISSLGGKLGMTTAKQCSIADVSLLGVSFEVPEDPLLFPDGSRTDILRLCVQIARNMIDLFRSVVDASGFEPELFHFTDADLR